MSQFFYPLKKITIITQFIFKNKINPVTFDEKKTFSIIDLAKKKSNSYVIC